MAAASDSLSAVFVLPFFFQLFKLCPIIPHTSYRCCSGSVASLVGRFFLVGTSTGQRYALFPCQSSLLPTVLIVKQFPGSQPCQWWPTGKPSSAASGYFFFFAKKSPLLYAVLGVYWPSPSPPLSLSPPQAFYSFYPIDYVILLLPPLNLGFESVTACCKSSPRRQFIESAVSFILSIAPVCRQESLCSSQFSSETLRSVAFAFGSCVLHPSWSILHHLPASYKLILISPLVSASL